MPTIYTKETALYDPGKIRDDIGHAAETASSYITEISGTDGISVHDANDELNFVNIDANGVHIYSDDGNDNAVNVATFGATSSQIGGDDSGHLVTESDGISIFQSNELLCEITSEDGWTEIAAKDDIYGTSKIRLSNNATSSGVMLYIDRDGSGVLSTAAVVIRQLANGDQTFNVIADIARFFADLVADSVTVSDHSGPIGETVLDSGSKSIASAASPYTVVRLSDQIQLTPGTYVLVGDAVFPNDSSGIRHLEWRKSADTILGSGMTVNATAGGVPTRIQSTTIISLDQTSYLDLGCYQTSGSTLNVTWYIKVVRIA